MAHPSLPFHTGPPRSRGDDGALIRRFREEPEGAYVELLERFTPVLLRMIRRFLRDPDEVMEVYTAICERLRASDFQALRRFRENSELMPWLSVVAANACRDRLRKQRVTSVPRSVIKRLDAFEELVFKYYYWQRLPHEDIAEIINSRHDRACSPIDVVYAIARINDLLSVNKRWQLIAALNANLPRLSIDEMAEHGFQPPGGEEADGFDETLRQREDVRRLNEALAELDQEDQLVVLLRFEQEMTAPQIAAVMGYDSHKYVYTRLRTIITRLRRILQDD